MQDAMYGASNFIWFLGDLIDYIFDVFPEIWDLTLLVFFSMLVLGILKSARYRENGG